MLEYDVSRATKAVQLLVEVSHFNDYVKTLNRHVGRPPEGNRDKVSAEESP